MLHNDSLDDALQPKTERQAMDRHSIIKQNNPIRRKRIIIVVAFLVIIGGLGAAGVMLVSKSHKAAEKVVETPVTQPLPVAVPTDVPTVSDSKTYASTKIGVKLTHPSNWTATETADTGVRIESPLFSYQTISKGNVQGKFRIFIRTGARKQDSTYIGRGYAIQPSQKITYGAPAAGQRTDTLLQLFGLDTPENFAYFFVAGNFQLARGDTLGPNYGQETGTYIISGGFSAADLTDDMATNPVSPSLLQTSAVYKQAVDIIKSLQLS